MRRRILPLACAAALLWTAVSPARASAAARTYAGTRPMLRLTFAYPDGWRLAEDEGRLEPYHAVRLLGPRNAAGTYTAYIALTGRPAEEPDGTPRTTGRIMAKYRRALPDGAEVVSQRVYPMAGTLAEELVVSYLLPPMHRHGATAAASTPVTTRTILLVRGDVLYELEQSADSREAAPAAAAFDQLLASLVIP
jgi:hypothetical protein